MAHKAATQSLHRVWSLALVSTYSSLWQSYLLYSLSAVLRHVDFGLPPLSLVIGCPEDGFSGDVMLVFPQHMADPSPLPSSNFQYEVFLSWNLSKLVIGHYPRPSDLKYGPMYTLSLVLLTCLLACSYYLYSDVQMIFPMRASEWSSGLFSFTPLWSPKEFWTTLYSQESVTEEAIEVRYQ